jgi:outer membrane protein assembly factor BamB
MLLGILPLLSLQLPWPSFRGPDGSGHAEGVAIPADFEPARDLQWRTPAPGGFSSPILMGDSVVLTGSEDGRLQVLSIDARDGSQRWRRWVPAAGLPGEADGTPDGLRESPYAAAEESPHAAATPATDGRAVYAFFPSYGLVAYEGDGELRWRRPLGPLRSTYPVASSPVVADGVVYQLCDHEGGGFLLALDAETGDVRWRADRSWTTSGFSTPLLAGDVLVVAGSNRATAYDLESGDEVWWLGGLSWQSRASPVAMDGVVYLQSFMPGGGQGVFRTVRESFSEALERWDGDGSGALDEEELAAADVRGGVALYDHDEDGTIGAEEWKRLSLWTRSENGLWAVRLGGTGDVRESHLLWRANRAIPQSATPILLGETLVMLRDGGLLSGLDPATGEYRYSTRIEEIFSEVFSSPISAGGELVLAGTYGAVAVVEDAEHEPRVRVSWTLDELTFATPAIGDGALYVRTEEALYCYRLDGRAPLPSRAFVGVDVRAMDGAGLRKDQTLVVSGGRILALGPRATVPLPEGAEVVECSPGQTIAPGLIDLWVEVVDEHELPRYLLAGVTGIRCVDGRPALLEMRARVRRGDLPGPVWSIGGPALDPRRKQGRAPNGDRYFDTSRPSNDTEELLRQVEACADGGYDFASTELGLSGESWLAVAARARELGLPFLGAPPYGLPLTESLARRPVTLDRAEALYGDYLGQRPDHRGPPLRRVAWLLAESGVPVTPMLSSYDAMARAVERLWEPPEDGSIASVSPLARVLWARNAHNARRHFVPEQFPRMAAAAEWQRALVRALDRAGVELLCGSDAMSPFVHPGEGLHRELAALTACGLTPERALRSVTSAAGRVLGTGAGVLEEGAPADLILLGGDPLADLEHPSAPLGTMVRGRWYPREELELHVESARRVFAGEEEFIRTVATWNKQDVEGLVRYLETPEALAAEVRPGSVDHLIDLFLHPGIDIRTSADALRAYSARRWPDR